MGRLEAATISYILVREILALSGKWAMFEIDDCGNRVWKIS